METYDEFRKNTYLNSGFYYDSELKNPFTRVTLHPNQKWTEPKTEEGKELTATQIEAAWQNFTGEEAELEGDQALKKEANFPYSRKPIASAILGEDFSVSVANNFSDFGADQIGNMWNEMKPMSPYLSEFADIFGTISAKTQDYMSKNGYDSSSKMGKVLDYLGKFTDLLKKNNEKQANYLYRSLAVKGTSFRYYNGSGVNFDNLGMKFTIMGTWEDNKYVSVEDQVRKLLPYVIGKFIPISDVSLVGETNRKFIESFASWQMPPGNFTPDLQNIDSVQKGTLKLKFGALYSIENLVITGCNFNFSKATVEYCDGSVVKQEPLYCDISLQLSNASKMSSYALEQFIKRPSGTWNKIEQNLKQYV